MDNIKIINKRHGGNLYHYAHFIIDCIIPEINNEIFKYKNVYRIINLDQTLGIFSKIYEDIMQIKNIELNETEFKNKTNCNSIIINGGTCNINKQSLIKAQTYIFNRYNIKNNIEQHIYPEILLIKRGNIESLIKNKLLIKNKRYYNKNGNERRKINNIEIIEKYLLNSKHSYESIILENTNYETQIRYFYNAKIIIGVHGAGLTNVLYCKQKTLILEIKPVLCEWFKNISNMLNLIYYRCDNNTEVIKNNIDNMIDEIEIEKVSR